MLPEHVDSKHVTYGLAVTLTSRAVVVTALYGVFVMTDEIARCAFERTRIEKLLLSFFFLNDQPDALIIQIYSVIKLYMFRASYCL